MERENQSDKTKEVSENSSKSIEALKGFDPIVFFKKDKKFVFAHQKIEKLVSAVYLMTNSFQDEEPVKWSLRTLGTELLRLNIDLKESTSSGLNSIEIRLRERVLEMVSLLEVAFFAGLVSEMNLLIIKKEFHNLLNHVSLMLREKNEGSSLLGSPFFDIENDSSTADLHKIESRDSYQHMSHISAHSEVKSNEEKDLIKDKTYLERSPTYSTHKNTEKKLKEYGPVAVKRNKRQSVIINLLKRKKEIMVRDVAEIVHDCSEKTLQRELLALVSQGVLRKEGERRWSRYSLA